LVSVLVPASLADPVAELPDVPLVEPVSDEVEPDVLAPELPVDPVVAERSLSSAELVEVRGELSFAFELVESVELASLFSSLLFSSVIDESVADVPVSVAVDPVMPVCELLPVPVAVPVPAVPESDALDPLVLVSGVVPVGLVSLEVVLAESL
jgi:hypothetical protein